MNRDGAGTWYGSVNQSGSFSVLARVTSLAGTGYTVVDREGPCVKQADVIAIACKVFDLGTDKDNTGGTELTPDPVVVVATAVFDTLQTAGWPTDDDPAGYNFRHDIGSLYDMKAGTGDVGEWYLIQYQFSLVGGGTAFLKVKVQTEQTR